MESAASYNFPQWFLHQWSRAALPLAVILLLLSPFLVNTMSSAAFLAYLLLPLYMIHQYEEHAHGEFKNFVNRMLAHGQEKVTDVPIFWVNIGGVWIVFMLVLYGANYVHPALALITAYTTVVNGLSHLVIGIRQRRYNPGLATSVLLFLPVGSYAIYAISQTTAAAPIDHALGIGGAIVVRALTLLYLRRYLISG